MNFPLTKCVKLNCDTKIAKESGKCDFLRLKLIWSPRQHQKKQISGHKTGLTPVSTLLFQFFFISWIFSNQVFRTKKIKRYLFLNNRQALKHKITIEFCFISASLALTFANLTNEKWNKSIPKYFLTKFQNSKTGWGIKLWWSRKAKLCLDFVCPKLE